MQLAGPVPCLSGVATVSTHSSTGTPIIYSRLGLILAVISAPSAYSLLLSFRRREKISKKSSYLSTRPHGVKTTRKQI